MVELESNDSGVEACVHGMQNRTGHGHPVVSFQHRRHVGQHDADRIVLADSEPRQCGSKLARPPVKGPVVGPLTAMDDRNRVRKHIRRSCQEAQRTERCIIGGVLVETPGEGVDAGIHDHPP